MYYYFYDSFLNEEKYQKALHRIENRLVDLGINGKIGRGSLLINQEKVIKEEVKKGARTIIAVGNDDTLNTVASAVYQEKEVTIGIIPLGKNNEIARILGIPEGYLACDILSQRRVKRIDAFSVNKHIGLSFLYLRIKKVKETKIFCEQKFEISLLSKEGEVFIYNLANKKEVVEKLHTTQNVEKYFNPADGYLDLVIRPQKKGIWQSFVSKFSSGSQGVSIIPFQHLEIKGKEEVKAFYGQKPLSLPLRIEIIPQALSVIVGKDRKF